MQRSTSSTMPTISPGGDPTQAGVDVPAQLIERPITIPGAHGAVAATVAEVGRGTPFVFLHGLVGLNEHWDDVARRFSSHARCVLLQIPLLQLEGDDCCIQGVTDLTVRFLRQHFARPDGSVEPVCLVGNSFGGHVALRLAIEQPSLVRGLVLAGSSGLIEKSIVSDVQIRPSRDWLRRKIGELFYDERNMREADLDRAFKELSSRSGARAMVKLSRSARRNHLGAKLGQIGCPTMLIWGKQDIVTPPEAAEGFLAAIKGSRITWFDRCGHAPMIECPGAFADAMLDFERSLK